MFFSGPGRKLAPATASLVGADSTLLVADSRGYVLAFVAHVPPEVPVHLRHVRPFAEQMVSARCRWMMVMLQIVLFHVELCQDSPSSSRPSVRH